MSPAFERREIAVAPGCTLPYDEDDWRDAIVVVERGQIVLECSTGVCGRFDAGAMLWLTGLPLRALHNRGHEPALLVAAARADDFRSGAPF